MNSLHLINDDDFYVSSLYENVCVSFYDHSHVLHLGSQFLIHRARDHVHNYDACLN